MEQTFSNFLFPFYCLGVVFFSQIRQKLSKNDFLCTLFDCLSALNLLHAGNQPLKLVRVLRCIQHSWNCFFYELLEGSDQLILWTICLEIFRHLPLLFAPSSNIEAERFFPRNRQFFRSCSVSSINSLVLLKVFNPLFIRVNPFNCGYVCRSTSKLSKMLRAMLVLDNLKTTCHQVHILVMK